MCDTPMFMWLLVFAGLCCGRMLKNFIVALVLHNANDPLKAEAKIDVLYCCTILNFEFAWLIYGNTFHYSPEGIACMQMTNSTKAMWILMQIILIYGYFVFVLYGFIFAGAVYLLVMTIIHRR